MPETHAFQARLQRLDDQLQQAGQHADPAAQARLEEIAAELLALHRDALDRILELISSDPASAPLLDALCRDEAVAGILVLHGLHPLDLETRVRGALEKVKPYLASHGGHVELVSIAEDGILRLRLHGSCHGCPSSRVTLQSTIEQEIYAAAPEVSSIEVDGLDELPPEPPRGFVPLGQLAVNGAAMQMAP